MKKLILFLGIIALINCWSCTLDSSRKTKVESEITKPKNISFSSKKIKGIDEMGGPKSKIFVHLDDNKHLIDVESIPSLKEMMSPSKEMKNSLSSTGGWWAGFGANYAAFLEGDKIIIKKEIVEEIPEAILNKNPELLKPQVTIIKEIKY